MVRFVEGLGLLIFHLSLSWWMMSSLSLEETRLGPALFITSLLLGFFLADWFSGIVHWMCDRLGTPETPLWGAIVGPFRDHHDDPMQITRISLTENLGASAIAGCLFFWITFPFIKGNSFLSWTWFWFLLFAFFSNLFHRWSHFPEHRRPGWMNRLQKYGVLLRPSTHLAHHRRPYRINYCILSGWANSITNRTPWRVLEKGLSTLGVKICD